jgi:hypothetical protein
MNEEFKRKLIIIIAFIIPILIIIKFGKTGVMIILLKLGISIVIYYTNRKLWNKIINIFNKII